MRTRATEHAIKAIEYFRMLQCEDGHWAGDYGGPHFLLPGLVIVWYVTGRAEHVLNKKQRAAMSHYLRVHQQRDGGWGKESTHTHTHILTSQKVFFFYTHNNKKNKNTHTKVHTSNHPRQCSDLCFATLR